jgi:hypothetical protein
MRRRLILALVAALVLPTAALAQSASPAASPGMVGVDTFDVCLSISGPVIEMTAESLTQGITDGTFTINGLSTACEMSGAEASPGMSPAAEAASPAMSPAASPAA